MLNPNVPCDNHLLGEHVELHMLVGCINKGRNLNNYMKKGLVDLHLIRPRHQVLVKEMEKRGFTHVSVLPDYWLQPTFMGSENPKTSLNDLCKRCLKCGEAINHANLL